jgi:hypothetical protein
MAEKRMFSKRVISSDAFLDMSVTAQLFYFHLSMMADDDGFVDSTRSVMRSVGANEKDLNTLIEKEFIIYFKEESISLIRHWLVSNNIRKDTYKETKYKELKNRLSIDGADAYTLQDCNEIVPEPLQDCNEIVPQIRLDQISIDQVSINSSGFAESKTDDSPPSPKTKKPKKPSSKQKSKKPPLREREPVNDMERVEKAYRQNWDTLFAQRKVKTAEPVINWNQTRNQLKNHFERVKPELIIQAINNGMTDDFVLGSGYSLGIMLSAKVLNRLINASAAAAPPGLADKNALSGLTSTF